MYEYICPDHVVIESEKVLAYCTVHCTYSTVLVRVWVHVYEYCTVPALVLVLDYRSRPTVASPKLRDCSLASNWLPIG